MLISFICCMLEIQTEFTVPTKISRMLICFRILICGLLLRDFYKELQSNCKAIRLWRCQMISIQQYYYNRRQPSKTLWWLTELEVHDFQYYISSPQNEFDWWILSWHAKVNRGEPVCLYSWIKMQEELRSPRKIKIVTNGKIDSTLPLPL